MIKITIFIITLCFYGCNISSNSPKISEIETPYIQNLSISATYLSANYYISKGDVYTASRILNTNTTDLQLLKLKFISNLISGNFEYANKISIFLSDTEKSGPAYQLSKFAISLDKNNLEYSLQILKIQFWQ